MIRENDFLLAIDFINDALVGEVSPMELALIYSVLPELTLDILAGNPVAVSIQ